MIDALNLRPGKKDIGQVGLDPLPLSRRVANRLISWTRLGTEMSLAGLMVITPVTGIHDPVSTSQQGERDSIFTSKPEILWANELWEKRPLLSVPVHLTSSDGYLPPRMEQTLVPGMFDTNREDVMFVTRLKASGAADKINNGISFSNGLFLGEGKQELRVNYHAGSIVARFENDERFGENALTQELYGITVNDPNNISFDLALAIRDGQAFVLTPDNKVVSIDQQGESLLNKASRLHIVGSAARGTTLDVVELIALTPIKK